MIVTGSREHGLSRRRHLRLDDGFEYFKGEWLESGRDPHLSPTMFLVEQGPHSRLAPHFHRENEFQVVVQGGGRFGAHDVQAVTVHYAGAFTGYGPVIAGDQGLSYFTIRSVFEQGAVLLPGREHMVRGPKRQFHTTPYPAADAQALATRRTAESVELLPPQTDGIAATRILLPPGGTGQAPTPAGGSGQYVMVIAGTLLHEGRTFTQWEPIFLSPDESPLPLRAGPGGADVLALRLAVKAPEYVAAAVA
jgi:quercetin dioxygenase-like cupin family protein